MMDGQEQNEPKQSQETSFEIETDVLDLIRNNAFAACLGILKYIAVVFPRFLFDLIVRLAPGLVKLTGKIITLVIVLTWLAFMLAWPYLCGDQYGNEEFWLIIQIIWLIVIGIPGVYLGIKSRSKWKKQWQNWRNRVKAAKPQAKQEKDSEKEENQQLTLE
jgi:uncharacterized membrane protein